MSQPIWTLQQIEEQQDYFEFSYIKEMLKEVKKKIDIKSMKIADIDKIIKKELKQKMDCKIKDLNDEIEELQNAINEMERVLPSLDI